MSVLEETTTIEELHRQAVLRHKEHIERVFKARNLGGSTNVEAETEKIINRSVANAVEKGLVRSKRDAYAVLLTRNLNEM